jgi:O-antigen chain-terminating methyltransferase
MDYKMNFENIDKKGYGDSERCIEIPWALSKYSGEQTVLDIGYANAEERYIKSLLLLNIPCLYGLDISEKHIEGIISHIGDIRNTDFNDNFFDLVFCISTIEHIGRDNAIYKKDFYEDADNGDFEALKEIFRITKNEGNVVLTVPFGKFFDYGWFIHYDENRLKKLLSSSPFEIVEMEFFRYENGWQKCDKSELIDTLYNDNNAPAAAGLVCILLEKSLKKPVSIQKHTTNDEERTMTDNAIEIRDDQINTEDVLKKIRENIRHRQTIGEYPTDSDILNSPLSCACSDPKPDDSFHRDFTYISSNWDIHNYSYKISSHRHFIGTALVKGRQLVHGEIRRYVDPTISWQTEFNASTVRILTRTLQTCTELTQRQKEMDSALSSFRQDNERIVTDFLSIAKNELALKIERTTKDHDENLTLLRNEIHDLFIKCLKDVRKEFDAELDSRVREEQQVIKENRDEINRAILSSISELKKEFYSKHDQVVLADRSEIDNLIIKNLNAHIHPDELNIDTFIEQGRIKVKEKVDARVKELFSQMDNDIKARTWLVHMLEDRVKKGLAYKGESPVQATENASNYFLFEERFRGSRDTITQRQLEFLPYFEKCSRVLDIGCGRGEFLEILKDRGIGAIGVDIDPDMVSYCHSRQLEVMQSDAIAYLETLDDNSLDGIFIDQVVEHLEPDYLIRLLALCCHKIKFGYHIVVETVNPLSFVSFVNFYIDLTHKKPVHPETLQYLLSASGFRICEIKYFSPVPEEAQLGKISNLTIPDEIGQQNIDTYNKNIEKLNAVLFGAQDYAIIAKR